MAAAQLELTFPVRLRGLRPSRGIAALLDWYEHERIDQLTACYRRGDCSLELLNAAKAENPARIAEKKAQLWAAILWEKQRYGNTSLDVNPRLGLEAA